MREKQLSYEETAFLCQELSLLLHAGVGAGDGLSLLAEETREPEGKSLLTNLARRVDEGGTLSAALRESGRFSDYVSGLVEVGEHAGRTEEALSALARYYEDRVRMDRRLRSALLYPAVLLLVMLAVIVVLLAKVLPVFNDVYASLGGRLTGLAGGLLTLGRWLDAALPALCVLLAAAVAFLAAFAAGGAFRARVLAAWRRNRGHKGVTRAMDTARFAQALAMGMASGLPLEESLTLSASLLRDAPAAVGRCEDCAARLAAGSGVAEALRDSGALPAASCRLLGLGLRSGSGDGVMADIARRLSEDGEAALESQVSRVEPALVLVTSVLVGAILLSVMLPLMHIMAAIG